MPRTSDTYTPATPIELQREDPPESDCWTVVSYHSATPDEASLPGYRVVDRTPKKKGAA